MPERREHRPSSIRCPLSQAEPTRPNISAQQTAKPKAIAKSSWPPPIPNPINSTISRKTSAASFHWADQIELRNVPSSVRQIPRRPRNRSLHHLALQIGAPPRWLKLSRARSPSPSMLLSMRSSTPPSKRTSRNRLHGEVVSLPGHCSSVGQIGSAEMRLRRPRCGNDGRRFRVPTIG